MASRNRGYARGVLDAMVMVSQHGIAHSRRGHMHKARLAQLVFPSFKRPHGLHRRTFFHKKSNFSFFSRCDSSLREGICLTLDVHVCVLEEKKTEREIDT